MRRVFEGRGGRARDEGGPARDEGRPSAVLGGGLTRVQRLLGPGRVVGARVADVGHRARLDGRRAGGGLGRRARRRRTARRGTARGGTARGGTARRRTARRGGRGGGQGVLDDLAHLVVVRVRRVD